MIDIGQVKGKTTKKELVTGWGQGIVFCLLCCGFCAAFPLTVHAQAGFVPSLDDATFEKYDGLQLESRIHITRTFVDHERWGFLKVGLAPIGVMEGVRVQILSAGSMTNALETLNTCNIPSAKTHRMEFRDLEISLMNEQTPRLRAESARIGRFDTLELSHVSISNGLLGTVSISKATLQVSGPHSGRLSWNDSGNPKLLFLFNP
jgi:hypothetical protein